MKIKVSTGFSKERVENFYKFHMTRIDKMRHLFFVGVFGLFLLTAISFLLVKTNSKFFTIGIIAFIADVILVSTRPFRLTSAFKKAIKNNPVSEKTYYVLITDDGIKCTMDGYDSFYKWDTIVRVCEILDAYYIYTTDTKAIIVPKFSIKYEERDEFEKFVFGLKNYKYYKY